MLDLDPVGWGLENPGFSPTWLKEATFSKGARCTRLSSLVHSTEGTDTLTRHQHLLVLPTTAAFSSPPRHPWPSHYQALHHRPGRGCHVPTQHKSMGRHLRGARVGSQRPSALPRRLPHPCCRDAKGRSRGTLVEKPGRGRGGNGGLHFFRLLTVISLVSEM